MTFLTLSKYSVKIIFISFLLSYLSICFATDSTNTNLNVGTMTAQKLQANTSTTTTSNQDVSYSGSSPSIPTCPQGYAATRLLYTNPSYSQARYYQTYCSHTTYYCNNSLGIYSCECDFQGCPGYCCPFGFCACNNNSRDSYCDTYSNRWVNSSSVLSSSSQDYNVSRVTCSKITTNWVPYNTP